MTARSPPTHHRLIAVEARMRRARERGGREEGERREKGGREEGERREKGGRGGRRVKKSRVNLREL